MNRSARGAVASSGSTVVGAGRARRRLRLAELLLERRWVPVAGYGFYVALLTAGYSYNLTFVQLGLIDLGSDRLGMSGQAVSAVMALLAVVALTVSVTAGVVLDRRGWSGDLRIKLRLLTVVTATQPPPTRR